MATKVIGDYTAAITIDGATHFLLIQPGNAATAYKKISRNVLLGITSQPIGQTDVQGITNKTLDNSNTITLLDDYFTLQDGIDPTKQGKFQLSGITTGTTRTYTLPDATTTIVGTGVTQTLTNKTLTSPTITGGTIDNSTVTVDTIAGHTTPTTGTVYGIAVTTGTIAAAALASNSVITAKIIDGAVTPAKLITGTGSTWVWQSYVPTFTNMSGGAITYAKYLQVGKTVFFRVKYTLAGAGISGSVTMSLPVNFNADYTALNDSMTGTVQLTDTATAAYLGALRWNSASTVTLLTISTAGLHVGLSSTVPFTWGNTDTVFVSGEYEVA